MVRQVMDGTEPEELSSIELGQKISVNGGEQNEVP